jgi:hypothetical protein
MYQAPEKIEFVNGIFASERERLNVLGMLLENLGIDKVIRFGKLDVARFNTLVGMITFGNGTYHEMQPDGTILSRKRM